MNQTHQSKYGPYGPMVQNPKSKYGPYGSMVQNNQSKYGPYGSIVKKRILRSKNIVLWFYGQKPQNFLWLTDMEDGVTVRGHSRPVMGYDQDSCIGAVSRQALHQRLGRIDVQRTVELVKHED